jgi:hypothetical protein
MLDDERESALRTEKRLVRQSARRYREKIVARQRQRGAQ